MQLLYKQAIKPRGYSIPTTIKVLPAELFCTLPEIYIRVKNKFIQICHCQAHNTFNIRHSIGLIFELCPWKKFDLVYQPKRRARFLSKIVPKVVLSHICLLWSILTRFHASHMLWLKVEDVTLVNTLGPLLLLMWIVTSWKKWLSS